MNFFTFIKDWVNENPGKAVGGFIGFVLGILFLTIGIVKTLLILLLIAIGIVIGKMRDENISFLDSLLSFSKRKKD